MRKTYRSSKKSASAKLTKRKQNILKSEDEGMEDKQTNS